MFRAVLRLGLPALLAFSAALAQGAPFAYITNANSDTVSVVDTTSNTVSATVPVGVFPIGVAVTPDGAFVYVTNFNSGTVSVIATASNTVSATVPVGTAPAGVAVTPDGAFVYVTNQLSNTVSVITTASNTVSATVPVGTTPAGVAVTANGAFVYVTNRFSNAVSVIATASNTVSATVPVGNFPLGVAVTPDGAFVYVANFDSDTVSVIATASNTVSATVPVGNGPGAFGKFIGPAPAPVPGSDLAVIKTDSPDPVLLSDSLTYTLTVSNEASADATGVMLTDTLPGGVTFVSATPSQGSCGGAVGGAVSCSLGDIASGGSATVTLIVNPTQTGTITNTVEVSANETDADDTNNTATEETSVIPVTCDGLPATIIGKPGVDIINGTNGNDVIHGLSGNDTINGGNAGDRICGATGMTPSMVAATSTGCAVTPAMTG